MLHGVDATKLEKNFPAQKFERIIFNFPHTGEQRVHLNRALLHDFFQRLVELSSSRMPHLAVVKYLSRYLTSAPTTEIIKWMLVSKIVQRKTVVEGCFCEIGCLST